jgi:hypothetical protein
MRKNPLDLIRREAERALESTQVVFDKYILLAQVLA